MAIHGVLLYVYCSSLLVLVRGFIEVGLYSKLDTTQSFNTSTIINSWKDSGSKGLGSHNAGTFLSNFTAPSQGIYYVSTILVLEKTDKTILKTSILVNHNLKDETGLTGFQSYNGSVTVSGLVQLFIGDTVSVRVDCNSDSICTVFSSSTFFVQLVHSMTTSPAFQATLSRDVSISSSEWRRIEDWNAASASNFQVMSGFSSSLGTFCADFNGIYQIHANILLDLSQSINGSVALLFREQIIIESHFGGGKYATTSAGGMFNLKKEECIELRAHSLEGTQKIHQGSGFSTLFLATDESGKLLHAASYRLSAPAPVLSTAGLYTVGTWLADGSSVFFEASTSSMLLNGKSYQVQTEGQHFINAHVNMRTTSWSQSESVELLVIVDIVLPSGLSAASIVTKEAISFVNSLALTGVLYLKKGQTITLCIYKNGNSAVSLMENSLFSVSMVPKDWPGVSATLNSDQLISSPGWNEVGKWTIKNLAEGSFSFDGAFNTISGRYVTPLEGTYIVSCNLILNGTVLSPLEMRIVVDGNLDATAGLYSIRNAPKEHLTMSTSGLMRLLPGQYISVFVHIGSGSSQWTASRDSTLSIALNGAGKADEHGYIGLKKHTDVYTTKDVWEEVKGWQSRDSAHQLQDRWDGNQSRYTPLEDGIYYVSVNLLIYHSTPNTFQVLIAGDGNTNQYSGGQDYHSSQNSDSRFSLTASCSVRLDSSHFVSVFVKSGAVGSWKVLENSSISIVLISLSTNPHRAGINNIVSQVSYLVNKPFALLNYWQNTINNYGSTYKEKLDVFYNRIPKLYIVISASGLYFFEIGILNQQHSGGIFHKYSVALCIGIENKINFTTIVSTKIAEGPSATSKFGMSAFGVVYLTKGWDVFPCLSGGSDIYKILKYSGFSLVKIVPLDNNPGLRQNGAASYTDKSHDWTVASDWTSTGESSLYRFNSINPYGQESVNTLPGTYLFTSSLAINDNTFAPVTMCIGKQRCNACYLQSSVLKGGLTMTGVVALLQKESVYTCVRNKSVKVTRSAQLLPEASAKNSLFFRHSSFDFSTEGLKSLIRWTSDDGVIHKNVNVTQAGLYLVAINMVLRSTVDAVFKVSVNLSSDTNGRPKAIPGLYGVSWREANHPGPFGLTSLVRISPKSSLEVTVGSESNSPWKIEANATFSLALLTKDSTHPGFSVKRPFDSSISLTPNWLHIGDWIEVELDLVSPLSVARPGRYIVDENGIYLITATFYVSVKVPPGEDCTIEMIISIGGVVSDSSLKTLQVVKGTDGLVSRTVTLTIASSVRLFKWQAVFPMLRSTPAQDAEVLANNIFYVTLIDKQRHYSKLNGSSLTHITVHPVSFIRVYADVCQPIILMCEAESDNVIQYKWIKNGQFYKEVKNIVIANARVSDAGRYICVVESNNVSLASSLSTVEVLETRPIFLQRSFEASVNETTSGLPILDWKFNATSTKNKPANVSFSIIVGNINNTLFEIRPATSTNVTSLINTSPLDYEQTQIYHLTIRATNVVTRQSTFIFVTVSVIDINDNYPVFSPQEYTRSVPEGAWIGALIVQVTATDKDSGNNGRIEYAIEYGNEDHSFAIDSDGFVSINKSLDYEERTLYNLTITARDLGNPSLKSRGYAYVIINVSDANDNNPEFSSSSYSFAIREDSPRNTFVGWVNATDVDKGKNKKIVYSIQDAQMRKIFSVNQNNGEITLLQQLDYEVNKSQEFIVIATDQGSPPRLGAALVFVSILDVNDNRPVFIPENYSVDITEATIVGTEILSVRVNDKDSQVNSNVWYNIIRGNLRGTFKVTDMGTVVLEKTLDRENISKYNLTLEAYDRDSPSLTPRAAIFVIINVVDVNDHYPVFDPNSYAGSFPENESAGFIILKVQATDRDSGTNAKITYYLDYGFLKLDKVPFAINKTNGVISLENTVDHDTLNDKTIRFRVVAKDGGSPSLMSYANVSITVTDVNDNSPVFRNVPRTIVHIPDDFPINRTVVWLNATDEDSGTNADIVYSIEQVKKNGKAAPSKFGIVLNKLYVSSDLKKDSEDRYEVTIKARDSGTPFLSTTANITIQVDDVNDYSPVFTKSIYKVVYNESQRSNTLLYTVSATDKDVGDNAVVDYTVKLFNSTDSCEKTSFRITSNGSIFNERELKTGNDYVLNVTARDMGKPALKGSCTVKISINSTLDKSDKNETKSKHSSDCFPLQKEVFVIIISILAVVVLVLVILVVHVILKFRRLKSQGSSNSLSADRANKHDKSSVQFLQMKKKPSFTSVM